MCPSCPSRWERGSFWRWMLGSACVLRPKLDVLVDGQHQDIFSIDGNMKWEWFVGMFLHLLL